MLAQSSVMSGNKTVVSKCFTTVIVFNSPDVHAEGVTEGERECTGTAGVDEITSEQKNKLFSRRWQ